MTSNLMEALSLFQGEVQDIFKDSSGYGYKYASLSGVLEITRPLCAKHGLSVTQLCVNTPETPNIVGINTILAHKSGEYLSSTLYMTMEPRKGMSLCQNAGTAITYMRRYAICSALNLTQTDNDASIKEPEPRNEMVSADLICKLRNLIEDKQLEDKIPTWRAHFKVDVLENLSVTQLKQLITRIEESN